MYPFKLSQSAHKPGAKNAATKMTIEPDKFRRKTILSYKITAVLLALGLLITAGMSAWYVLKPKPTLPTAEPTEVPTAEPTVVPTAEPTVVPTAEPTEVPTVEPTVVPTVEPTEAPTLEPTEVRLNLGFNGSDDAVFHLGLGKQTNLTFRLNDGERTLLSLGRSFSPIGKFSACGSATEPLCYQLETTSQERYTVKLAHEVYSTRTTRTTTTTGTDSDGDADFVCTTVSWTGDLESDVTDCLDLGGNRTRWFGGGELREQHWPMQLQQPMTQFVSSGLQQQQEWLAVGDYQETKLEIYQRKKKIAYAITGIVVVLAVGIITAMALWFVLKEPPPPAVPTKVDLRFGASNESRDDARFELDVGLPLKLTVKSEKDGGWDAVLNLGATFGPVKYHSVCPGGSTLERPCYLVKTNSTQYRVELQHEIHYRKYEEAPQLKCTTVGWTADLAEEVTDCIGLGGGEGANSRRWFGGGLLFEQRWPMTLDKPMTEFVSADILQVKTDYGSLLEPYWISTDGIAVIVEYDAKNQPLHTSWNNSGDGQLCISARFRDSSYVYADQTSLKLKYSVCVGSDIAHVHQSVLQYRNPWPKPSGIPAETIFEKPIWSTWVSFKKQITQDKLVDFINDIVDKGFNGSHIEIDDGYHVKYGDFSFNNVSFPRPKDVINLAKQRGFTVTVWVYHFLNHDSQAFMEAVDEKFLVWDKGGKTPAITSWWDGKIAGLLDFTNPNASDWFFNRLKAFQNEYGIESFKFDGGESNWTPDSRQFFQQSVNPDYLGKVYSHLANDAIGNALEVRIGLHTQELPVFVRMLDKDSVPGYDNGLKTMIPTALVFGLLGYPFILPDMIGGNAYRNTSGDANAGVHLEGSSFPSEKLYLRWLAATIFMPSVQFSITPWHYPATNELDPTAVALKLLKKREAYTDLFVNLAKESMVTGYPIIRPLWWMNGTDAMSWTIDDQFLVGDTIMIAPALDESSGRYIYIPPGTWSDELLKRNVTGPQNQFYAVPFDDVPVFRRLF
ncbi:putative family 31 glucosidase KIAA1161 [Hypsibius exemplaris]|uniref:Family 31 glucosidase KIAA1161 n=1 Tax=Hypsibius exemplaris TaxID=2072580 RepID=A0A1W0WH76_HYPEX|nr:putative family 31 glucosidase KIAA1161 [Hypsibius exemplaris]